MYFSFDCLCSKLWSLHRSRGCVGISNCSYLRTITFPSFLLLATNPIMLRRYFTMLSMYLRTSFVLHRPTRLPSIQRVAPIFSSFLRSIQHKRVTPASPHQLLASRVCLFALGGRIPVVVACLGRPNSRARRELNRRGTRSSRAIVVDLACGSRITADLAYGSRITA